MRRPLRPAVLIAAGLVAASAIGAVGIPGDELAACRSKSDGKPQVTIRKDRWVRINAPKFDAGEGPTTITSFTTPPAKKNLIYMTNGTVVKDSVDAGCTWSLLSKGNGVHPPGGQYTPDTFTSLAAPSDDSLWAASYDSAGGTMHPHVYAISNIATKNATPTSGQVDTGLPQQGKPVQLAVTRMTFDGYLVTEELPDPASGDVSTPARHLYTTYTPQMPDPSVPPVIQQAWKEVAVPAAVGRIAGVVTFRQSRTIGVWGSKGYTIGSTVDATPSWSPVGTMGGPIVTMDVTPNGQVSVVANTQQASIARTIDSAGKTLSENVLPVHVTSFAHGSRQSVFAVSGDKGTWGFDHRLQKWVDVTPSGVPTFTHLEMTGGTTGRIVLGQTPDALYRWDTYAQETFVEPPPPPGGVGPPPELPTSNLKGAVLTPTHQVVTVQPGAVDDVPVTFRVPPDPTPLEVFFIMDTTGSMAPAIRGLQKAVTTIAVDLRQRLGVGNACFGVGDVKDFSPDASYIYRTTQRVVCEQDPSLPKINAAVKTLTQGGGGSEPEAQTIGITQAMTGAGQNYPPMLPGQEAGFHDGAFHVIVLITDASFNQGGGYPTIDETARTLNAADTKIVSIQVDGSNIDGARNDMEALAVATDSLAPPSGVDCDGDGKRTYGDLGPGAPLVCETAVTTADHVQFVNIGPALISLLLAVKDPGTIAVQVTDPDNAVLRPIRGETTAIRDLKYENGLGFTMPVHCSAAQDGKDLLIKLLPTVRSQPIGVNGRILAGEVLVRCRKQPIVVVPPPPPPPPVEDPPIIPVPPHPPVVAAAPVPLNPPAQPPANVNPNAGFSQQEEEQFQVATVTQDAAETEQQDQESVELAMTGLDRHRTDPAAAGLAFGGAVVLSSAVALAHRRRLQRAFRPGVARV
jgi:hypothetical protein